MILQTSIDNQLPPWMVSAGAVLILIMLAGVALTIGRDIYNICLRWNACTRSENCARGSNVPTPTKIPEMPAKVKLKLVRHTGVDLEEITLKGRKNDCTAGDRLEDDDTGQRNNGR